MLYFVISTSVSDFTEIQPRNIQAVILFPSKGHTESSGLAETPLLVLIVSQTCAPALHFMSEPSLLIEKLGRG